MFDANEQAALDVCLACLAALKKVGVAPAEGRKDFASTLAPIGTAAHGRLGVGADPPVQFEAFRDDFANRMPWEKAIRMEEPLMGTPTILIDHDLAMVWTPFYFLADAHVTHVGTNCFTLLKADWSTVPDGTLKPGISSAGQEWKITGMTDTARKPTEEDLKKIEKLRKDQGITEPLV